MIKVAVVFDMVNLDEERKRMIDAVASALSKKFEVEKLPFDDDFVKKVKKFDAVFNLSTAYKQIHVPAILDVLNIPYTGSDALAHALCIDKVITKTILVQNNVPTPEFVAVEVGQLPPQIDFYPAIVKPSRQGSAKGIHADSVVHNYDELCRIVKRVHEQFNEPALVEKFIEGKELSVGIVAGEVLPILEIDFSELGEGLERFYSYRVKHYYGDKTKYYCPARIDETVRKKIEFYAKRAFEALRLKNYARMDLRLKDDEIYFLEVNSLPMLTPGYSDIIKMAEATGYSYDELILKIFEDGVMKCFGT
ncbi:D-alanine--D-alanine ligase family protein [Pseudothermotoga thermarum]|uniref:D-alanine--D-alanine ligase n=1 Tax=Pseudothermotoga thermarum DSM 5069 TaxID=688269 RepID=F7YTY1_9THEM|nr:ATP-grasp domain-containing protein [Pseudothermotoga thermarum]AEH51563.1 D-alanine--D-alanine ligase [Pseudothermotoga thermarum DSM 5069]